MAEFLYIAGWGRSGSTLLARILGEHPSMTFVGEVRGTFLRGVVENRRCGCGATFATCPFWTAVGEEAFGGWDRAPVQEALALRRRVDRPWWTPALRRGGRWPVTEPVRRYAEIFSHVTHALAAVAGEGQIIIDSSKMPSFAWVVDADPQVHVRTLHLVRDPRGTVFSWQKHVARHDTPDGRSAEMLRYGVLGASGRYIGYNMQAERLGDRPAPHAFARYEDLVTTPEPELDRLAGALGLPGWRAGQLEEGRVRLGVSHSVVGNPMRMDSGWMPLQHDDAWRDQMSRPVRALVTGVTAPMLPRYGYGLGKRGVA